MLLIDTFRQNAGGKPIIWKKHLIFPSVSAIIQYDEYDETKGVGSQPAPCFIMDYVQWTVDNWQLTIYGGLCPHPIPIIYNIILYKNNAHGFIKESWALPLFSVLSFKTR